jgi:hypothetical protein
LSLQRRGRMCSSALVERNPFDEAVGWPLSSLFDPFLSGYAFAFALLVSLVNLLALLRVALQVTSQFNTDTRWAPCFLPGFDLVFSDDRVEHFSQFCECALDDGIGDAWQLISFDRREKRIRLAAGELTWVDLLDGLRVGKSLLHVGQ